MIQPLPAGWEGLQLDLADVPEADFLALLPAALAFLLAGKVKQEDPPHTRHLAFRGTDQPNQKSMHT